MASKTVKNPSPCDCRSRSSSQKPRPPDGDPASDWARLNSVSARRKNPRRWWREPPTRRRPAIVKSARSASPRGVFAPTLAHVVPAFPPYAPILHTSAIASTIVDLPEPFSPTRKVTAWSKSRPCSATCRTAGRVNGQTGSGRVSTAMRFTNTARALQSGRWLEAEPRGGLELLGEVQERPLAPGPADQLHADREPLVLPGRHGYGRKP